MTRKHYHMGTGGGTKGVDPDTDTNSVTEGVASTGRVSKKGTVTHTEHWDGHVDATVKPAPLTAALTVHQGDN